MRTSLPPNLLNVGESNDCRCPLRLLVVDDDPVQQALMQRVAKRSGYETISATTLFEALHCVQSNNSFDCVVLDLNLGDGDGIDVCKAMVQSSFKGTLIVVSGEDASRRSAARACAKMAGIETRGLPKPLDVSSFRVCLADLKKALRGLPVMHCWGGLAVDQTMGEHRV